MSLVKGSIVRAAAGRDKGRFFVVLNLEDGFAYIADGKTRRLEKPKKKNPLHLAVTNTVIDKLPKSNPQLRGILKDFKSENGG